MKKIIVIMILFTAIQVSAQNPLLIPSTLQGTSIELTLQNGTHQFYEGINTTTMGANGNILGPTLLLKKGDFVDFKVNNQIADITTIHWHGMHVSPENDGGPHTTIAPNTTWNPSFTILDKAATYWYHPHLHEKTNEHVSKGIAGMIIVTDDEEAALALPRTYGTDDFPLVLQTKDFDTSKQIVVPSNADDVVMVNATIDAALSVPEQVVRLRLLNGSSMRVFNLGLSANQTFYQIASDGGLLSAPVSLTRLRLGPGERAEILVDFGGMNGQTIMLKSYASEFGNGIYGATNPGRNSSMTLDGYSPNPINGADFDMLQFDVMAATDNPVTIVPSMLVTVTPIPEANANKSRTITMSPVTSGMNQLNGDFYLNNALFDIDVINETVTLDNTEIWTIDNNSAIAHPFHIHDVQFYILDRDGVKPAPNEQGRKDVILVGSQEVVRFIAKFDNFSNPDVPYMYHCHMLIHEDGGMMGQFLVTNSPALSTGISKIDEVKVYPNPSSGTITLTSDDFASVESLLIFDQMGRQIQNADMTVQGNIIRIDGLQRGLYFIRLVSTDKAMITKKVIVE